MFITPSFKKSLVVEQFQGNYLKPPFFTGGKLISAPPAPPLPILYSQKNNLTIDVD